MGAAQSSFDPRHVRIWNILSSIESTNARITQLETLFSAQEYVAAAKKAGLYGTLLQWIAAQRRGEYYPWPIVGNTNTSALAPRSIPVMTRTPFSTGSNALANIPPPKRALDALHEAYHVLGLDDSETLTHERLRSAYKKKAAKAHPDKGGNAELFDKVTRAFLYIEEVLNKFVPKNARKSTPQPESRRIVHTNMENEIVLRNNVTDIAPMSVPVVAPMYSPTVQTQTAQTKEVEKIALNPKKLDINLFNKMFEENRLPDPETDEGYGSWLKSEETSQKASNSANAGALRSKYNKDLFNQMFEEEARRNAGSGGYNPPAEMVMSPGFGTELLGGKPNQYTNVMGAGGLGYTDLKYAYDEGNTFSHQVANVSLEGRPKTIEEAKAAYAKPPKPLTAEELAANSTYDREREFMEQQRIQRLSDRDRQAEEFDKRMKERLTITK